MEIFSVFYQTQYCIYWKKLLFFLLPKKKSQSKDVAYWLSRHEVLGCIHHL